MVTRRAGRAKHAPQEDEASTSVPPSSSGAWTFHRAGPRTAARSAWRRDIAPTQVRGIAAARYGLARVIGARLGASVSDGCSAAGALDQAVLTGAAGHLPACDLAGGPIPIDASIGSTRVRVRNARAASAGGRTLFTRRWRWRTPGHTAVHLCRRSIRPAVLIAVAPACDDQQGQREWNSECETVSHGASMRCGENESQLALRSTPPV